MANPEHLKILKQGVEVWNEWRKTKFEVRPGLSGTYLRSADLSRADLGGMILIGADLRCAKLSGANFGSADLSDAKLSGADLRWAKLRGADLRGMKLRYANFGSADLRWAKLRGADLSGAKLSGAYLRGADFSGAALSGADLINAKLSGANFAGAHLIIANLSGADLSGAGLSGANLSSADLSRADLSRADFSGAYLRSASLIGANLASADFAHVNLSSADLSNTNLEGTMFVGTTLTDANFKEAELSLTVFANIDLSSAIGLESAHHLGPSEISVSTIYNSKNNLPESFLLGCGVPEGFIEYARTLKGRAIEFYSCFLSHAEPDGDFAERLRTEFLSNGVSCWHYRYDMRGGQFWRAQINEAIKLHDKLVLICSERSLLRRNVVDEIIAAMERERETGSQKLFPVRLDDFILSDEMLLLADEKMAAGEWREDWVRYVRAYHIPDFSRWKDFDAYKMEFKNLLDSLKNPGRR